MANIVQMQDESAEEYVKRIRKSSQNFFDAGGTTTESELVDAALYGAQSKYMDIKRTHAQSATRLDTISDVLTAIVNADNVEQNAVELFGAMAIQKDFANPAQMRNSVQKPQQVQQSQPYRSNRGRGRGRFSASLSGRVRNPGSGPINVSGRGFTSHAGGGRNSGGTPRNYCPTCGCLGHWPLSVQKGNLLSTVMCHQ
jgi:hypothetical protein